MCIASGDVVDKKLISFFEIAIILVATISFSYFVGIDAEDPVATKENTFFSKITKFIFSPMIRTVSASDYVASGCCLETSGGAICQDMALADSAGCKESLVGTGCGVVEECKTGCCYSANNGICTLNAPKQKCEDGGGTWDGDELCNIEECQVGCCMLGDGAAMSTSRECTLLSNQYSFVKDFRSLDVAGSCDTYTDLSDEGACLTESTDYSNEKSCAFTTKGRCGGEFKKGYLCTSNELNTSCKKTDDTMCVEGKDEIYFVDSCGNRANVYDYSRMNDDGYWEKYISLSESCVGQGAECGNCDYKTGSVCTKYTFGKDLVKPKAGDYVCKNLNCADGRKHGESWCISDYDASSFVSSSVGSGSYIAKCMEGEISIEGCADFNQQICIESADTSFGFTEAKCVVNEWRTCLEVNKGESYSEVERDCSQNSQCIMFLDIPGNEKYDGLPGFKKDVLNSEQGNSGKIGEDANKVLAHCVPKYTPGFQFWTKSSNPFTGDSKKQESTQGYGGDFAETSALCSMGSFTCVSHQEIDKSIIGGTTGEKDKENPECNIDAFDQGKQKVSLLMEALNERCRSIGTCGTQTNVQGQAGGSFTITRVHINEKGKSETNYSVSGYNLTDEYLASIVGKQSSVSMGTFKTLSQISTISGGGAIVLLFYSLISGRAVQEMSQAVDEASAANSANAAEQQGDSDSMMQGAGLVSSLVGRGGSQAVSQVGYSFGSTAASQAAGDLAVQTGQFSSYYLETGIYQGQGLDSAAGSASGGGGYSFGTQLGVTAVAMVAAYFLGKLILKNSGMSPAEGSNFMNAMMAGASVVAPLAYAGLSSSTTLSSVTGIGGSATAGAAGGATGSLLGSFMAILGPLMFWISVAYFIYTLFSESTDHVYYIINYQCEAWTPPVQGDCKACNEDVRFCSEYKCRSLGNNCHYFVENGEPGYCASLSEVWSAKINPWQDVLTEGNKYTNVVDAGFKIEGQNKEEVAAWTPVTFGVTTDKQAICKIGLNHSASFAQMTYTMLSDKNYETGKVDGMHHKIVLSPHVQLADSDDATATTLPLEEGENEYYIKCRNFAGQENDAPFIVQITQEDGYDLTSALITRFAPEDKSYVAEGTNSTQVALYLNEPAECKYAIEYDESYYEDMNNSFYCLTGSAFGYYGEWPCYATIENLTKKTELFIKCKDQPELVETELVKRNVNSVSVPYTLNVCETGLEISSIEPKSGVIEVTNLSDLELKVQTSGCVNYGESVCSYSVNSYGGRYVDFLETGGRIHSQSFTNFGMGAYNISISCEDSAGNTANATTNFVLFKDDSAPVVNRIYQEGGKLVLKTSEDSFCLFNQNNVTLGCNFDFSSADQSYSMTHSLTLPEGNSIYYILCKDRKGNVPSGCSAIIRV